jgi:hypothetical protein
LDEGESFLFLDYHGGLKELGAGVPDTLARVCETFFYNEHPLFLAGETLQGDLAPSKLKVSLPPDFLVLVPQALTQHK